MDPALLRARRTELLAERTHDPATRRLLLEIARRWREEAGVRKGGGDPEGTA